MADIILSLFTTALFVGHFALVVYMLMWVAPRYWAGKLVNPELRRHSQ